jgi:hypothetical protein
MRRSLILVLVVALAALVFAPAAFAQDDSPTGDDFGGMIVGANEAMTTTLVGMTSELMIVVGTVPLTTTPPAMML